MMIDSLRDEVRATPIIGGTSADDFKLTPPFGYQITNWKVYIRSIVIGLFATKHKVGIGFGHAYKPTEKRGIITKSRGRDILTINGRKAADVYADWVGIPLNKLDILRQGLSNPLGVLDASGKFYWIKHPISVTKEGGISAASFPEGASVTLMETTIDAQIEVAREVARKAKENCDGQPLAAIMFHCAGRAAHLGDRISNMSSAIKGELGDIPIIGFNTYGEQAAPPYGNVGHHDLTLSILAIGKKEL